jgi:hypothetical protein
MRSETRGYSELLEFSEGLLWNTINFRCYFNDLSMKNDFF